MSLRYIIKHGSISLDFLTSQQDRVTHWFDDGFIECEKNCVWYISLSGEKKMTISTIGLINIYLRDGFLEETKEE
jgi:hypothetical protein